MNRRNGRQLTEFGGDGNDDDDANYLWHWSCLVNLTGPTNDSTWLAIPSLCLLKRSLMDLILISKLWLTDVNANGINSRHGIGLICDFNFVRLFFGPLGLHREASDEDGDAEDGGQDDQNDENHKVPAQTIKVEIYY